MELKRSEKLKIMKQDRKKDTPRERYARIQMMRDLKSRKRDKFLLITFTVLGLAMVLYAPKETSRVAGVWIMFISSLLSILV